MPRLTATNAGLSISGRQTSQFAATGKPLLPKDEPAPQPEPQPNVYRKNKKRDTVEFTPRKERERTMPFTRPAPPPRSGTRGRAGHDPKRYGAAAARACPAGDHRFYHAAGGRARTGKHPVVPA